MDTFSVFEALETLRPANHPEPENCVNSATQQSVARQGKAARALLGWAQKTLAHRAKLSLGTVQSFENGTGNARLSTINRIQAALEKAGVEFIPGDEFGGVGVRLSALS